MKSCKLKVFITFLIVFTSIAAIVHLTARQQVPDHALLITDGKNEIYVDMDDLKFETVTGIRANGKGEEIPVEAPGISVKDVLDYAGVGNVENVLVQSDDSYQAKISKAELDENGRVYLLKDEDGSLRLIVFGDRDSKRSVSHAVKIVVE